jgi:sulfatase maturation enzyme AslB (radical SAM superfamily)
MDKYKRNFHDRVKPQVNNEDNSYKVEPFKISQKVLQAGVFAKMEREEFFNEAFGEILADYFVKWLKSEAHATKEREFLYSAAMALGDVKARMIQFENLGNNAKFINQQAQEGAEGKDGK